MTWQEVAIQISGDWLGFVKMVFWVRFVGVFIFLALTLWVD